MPLASAMNIAAFESLDKTTTASPSGFALRAKFGMTLMNILERAFQVFLSEGGLEG